LRSLCFSGHFAVIREAKVIIDVELLLVVQDSFGAIISSLPS
jgi:hypothetical protein